MEEQTLHILNECSSGCKMAIHSMQQILEYVENEKLELADNRNEDVDPG